MTANEFLNQSQYNPDKDISFEDYHGDEISGATEQLMVDFVKYHVEKALKQASENCIAGCDFGNMSTKNGDLYATFAGQIGKVIIDKESILNAYPLNLIQ